jgi:hypothetical protein
MDLRGGAGRGWRRFRGFPIWAQVVIGLFVLSMAAAPFGQDKQTTVAAERPSDEGLPRASTTTEYQTPETTTPPMTEATTTTEPPTTVPPTTAPPATQPPAPRALVARPATTAAPVTAAPSRGSGCHPSYQGTCIPADVSDADCAGGSGNGPYYVQEKNIRVVGQDVFDLDRDGDGIGCES